MTQWVQLAGVPSPSGEGSIRDSSELQAAFALFNRVSAELTDSYRLLERRVEELSTELEQVDRARLRELEEKERLSERLRICNNVFRILFKPRLSRFFGWTAR